VKTRHKLHQLLISSAACPCAAHPGAASCSASFHPTPHFWSALIICETCGPCGTRVGGCEGDIGDIGDIMAQKKATESNETR